MKSNKLLINMKTKTLTAICLFALLSVNLISGAVLKSGLAGDKKNLV